MFWDDDELSVSVKTKPRERKLYECEVRSVFGSTDVNATATTPNLTPQKADHAAPPTSLPQAVNESLLKTHQSKLPRLPLPNLRQTCELYLKSLEGIVNAEEYEHSRYQIEEFLSDGGVGAELQKALEAREEKKDQPSWFEAFWNDAYLCARDPLPININYFFGFQDHPDEACRTQIGRAASLVSCAADIYIQIRDGTYPLDKERDAPLDMSQYRRVFCASRVPGKKRDHIITYSATPLLPSEILSNTTLYEPISPRHIVVMMRNRFFSFDILTDDGKAVLPLAEVTARFAAIVAGATAEGTRAGAPIGLFTTMDRDNWFEAREQLLNLGNDAALTCIQSAIIVVTLDAVQCEDLTEASRVILHGCGTNRWFDRHNLIVTRDGHAGLNFEHSVGDGTTTLRIADEMFRWDRRHCLPASEVEAILQAEIAGLRCKRTGAVKELTFKVDGSLDAVMRTAFTEYKALIESIETNTVTFTHFGGDVMKRLRVSPDAFVQLAFQLTHYKLFGRLEATYEASSTRGFLHGRTEVVRSVTRAVADFCAASNEPIFSRRINSKVPSLAELLRNAIEAHVAYMRRAKAGLGVDRHLFGLRVVAKEKGIPMPAVFTDPAFERSSHWTLSTSHCGSSALSVFGFGPVVNDGFGLGYMIKNDSVSLCVTAKHTYRQLSGTIFATMFESSMLHLKSILDCEWESRSTAKPKALKFTHPTAFQEFDYNSQTGFTYRQSGRGSLYHHQRESSLNFNSSFRAPSSPLKDGAGAGEAGSSSPAETPASSSSNGGQ